MVARSPPKQQRKMVVVLDPTLLRETVKKVDKCMGRLQELQYTVAGTKTYLRTSLRCKQDSLRAKNGTCQRSPPAANTEEWRRMSLPAMLLGETVGEILQATQFATNIVQALSSNATKLPANDPKTPLTHRRKQKQKQQSLEQSQLHARRKLEKQTTTRSQSDSPSPTVQRAKSRRINFKTSPLNKRGGDCRYIANRVSPRNRPWVKKAVLFPNPLFHSSPTTSHHQKFSRTNSPLIATNKRMPHKFLIKSPPRPLPSASSKFQVKIKNHPLSISPTNIGKKTSPKAASAAAKLRRSFSPSRLANRLVSPLKQRNCVQKNERVPMRRSFSPSRLAQRLVSPLKSRKIVHKNEGT